MFFVAEKTRRKRKKIMKMREKPMKRGHKDCSNYR